MLHDLFAAKLKAGYLDTGPLTWWSEAPGHNREQHSHSGSMLYFPRTDFFAQTDKTRTLTNVQFYFSFDYSSDPLTPTSQNWLSNEKLTETDFSLSHMRPAQITDVAHYLSSLHTRALAAWKHKSHDTVSTEEKMFTYSLYTASAPFISLCLHSWDLMSLWSN